MFRATLFASAVACVLFSILCSQTSVNAEPTEKEKAELAQKVYKLLKDKCYECHGEPGKRALGKVDGEAFNFILDYDRLVETRIIDTNDLEDSELYAVMKSGSMPRESGNTRKRMKLPQAEIDMVLEWVKAGAPKWDANATADKPGPKIAWNEVKGAGPGARAGHAMSEGPNDSIVVYGGGQGDSIMADTWVLAAGAWAKVEPKNRAPQEGGMRMAFDKKRGVCVMVGISGWTWEWDGKDWKEVKTEAKPPAREDFSLVFDSGDNVLLLFGGENVNEKRLFNDTWAFDGKAWKQLTSKNAPEARSGAALAYSPASKGVLLFGGKTAAGLAADTYLLSGGEWKKLSPANAPKAAPHLLMASSTSSTVLLCSEDAGMAATWLWNGKDWAKGPEGPKARAFGGIAYDGKSKGITVFGGRIEKSISETSWWQLTAAK